jgi:hypothetical protein
MISDVLSLLEFFNKMKSNISIKIAYFDGKGNKVRGDDDVNILVHKVQGKEIFFFEVQPITDYTFLRFPVNPGGVVEDLGAVNGEILATYFRYVGNSTISTGGQPNIIVPFIIYGYLTKALIEIGSPVGP